MTDLRARIASLVAALPADSSVTLTAGTLRSWLADSGNVPAAVASPDTDWRTRLWTCPPETRIGVPEVAEALGRGPDFVYRATSPRAARRLPHRKLGGELVFVARDVRAWIESSETDRVPALRVAR
jgi:predicted DNA-binding transcriptional regulator AlpA